MQSLKPAKKVLYLKVTFLPVPVNVFINKLGTTKKMVLINDAYNIYINILKICNKMVPWFEMW